MLNRRQKIFFAVLFFLSVSLEHSVKKTAGWHVKKIIKIKTDKKNQSFWFSPSTNVIHEKNAENAICDIEFLEGKAKYESLAIWTTQQDNRKKVRIRVFIETNCGWKKRIKWKMKPLYQFRCGMRCDATVVPLTIQGAMRFPFRKWKWMHGH